MSIAESEQYLEQIAQDDPELYAEIKKYFLSFEDLLDMPDHLMGTFWKNPELDIDALSKALKGYEQETIDNIVSNGDANTAMKVTVSGTGADIGTAKDLAAGASDAGLSLFV